MTTFQYKKNVRMHDIPKVDELEVNRGDSSCKLIHQKVSLDKFPHSNIKYHIQH